MSVVTDLLTLMGHKLEDPDEDLFTSAIKLLFLNEGQRQVVKKLKRQLLNDLDGESLNQTLDENGAYDYSGLSPYGGLKGVDRIKMVDTGKYADRISFSEYREYLNSNIQFYSDRPKYYVRGTNLYPIFITDPNDVASGSIAEGQKYKVIDYTSVTYNGTPYTDDQIFTGVAGVTTYTTDGSGSVIVANYIDIHFRSTPTALATNPGTCDLETDYHDAILAWALHLAWESVGDKRADKEAIKFFAMIKEWNDQFPNTETDPELDDIEDVPIENYESPYIRFTG